MKKLNKLRILNPKIINLTHFVNGSCNDYDDNKNFFEKHGLESKCFTWDTSLIYRGETIYYPYISRHTDDVCANKYIIYFRIAKNRQLDYNNSDSLYGSENDSIKSLKFNSNLFTCKIKNIDVIDCDESEDHSSDMADIWCESCDGEFKLDKYSHNYIKSEIFFNDILECDVIDITIKNEPSDMKKVIKIYCDHRQNIQSDIDMSTIKIAEYKQQLQTMIDNENDNIIYLENLDNFYNTAEIMKRIN
jgi:hypothetical protein